MTLVLYKIGAAVCIFLASLATLTYLIKRKRLVHPIEAGEIGDAFASGIFLGAAFFHMLPDAIKIFAANYSTVTFPVPEAVCLFSFLLLLSLERLSLCYQKAGTTHSIPYLLTLILTIHALTEGAALGVGDTIAETLLLFVAIVAHKGSESFALGITMLRLSVPLDRIIMIIIFFSLMTPLGIGLGTVINSYSFGLQGKLIAALFNAFAAGTFLYISTLHHQHLHTHQGNRKGAVEFLSMVAGVVIMGVIALWA